GGRWEEEGWWSGCARDPLQVGDKVGNWPGMVGSEGCPLCEIGEHPARRERVECDVAVIEGAEEVLPRLGEPFARQRQPSACVRCEGEQWVCAHGCQDRFGTRDQGLRRFLVGSLELDDGPSESSRDRIEGLPWLVCQALRVGRGRGGGSNVPAAKLVPGEVDERLCQERQPSLTTRPVRRGAEKRKGEVGRPHRGTGPAQRKEVKGIHGYG